MTATPETPLSPDEKDTTIRKSRDAVERAKAARTRLQNRRGSSKSKSKSRNLATGPDASRPNRSARRLSKIAPPPVAPPLPPQGVPPAHVQKEISTLEEKHIVKVLNKHFSKISEDIAQERAKNERALAEFNRKKEEFQARRRERDQSSASSTASSGGVDALVGVERMLRELHKRDEKIRRKEMDTKKLYTQYIKKYTMSQKTQAQENNEQVKQSFIETKTALERSPHAKNALRLDDIKAQQLSEFEKAMMSSPTKPAVATTVRNIDTTIQSRGSDAGIVAPRVSSYNVSSPLPPRRSSLSSVNSGGSGGGDYDAVYDRIVRRQSENRLVYEEKLNKRRGSIETVATVSSDESSESPLDDVSCLTDTELKLEDILRRDLAQFELEYDNTDDWSIDSGLSSFAVEERRSVAALERATKEMSDVVSLASASSKEDASKTEERWMAYWSDEHQREYYYEVNSRRVSWEKPDWNVLESSDSYSDDGSVSSMGSTRSMLTVGSLPTVMESKTEDGISGLKRRENRSLTLERIRRRRRKRIIRRTFKSVLFLTVVAAIGYHYKNEHVVRFVDIIQTYSGNNALSSEQVDVSDSIPAAMVSEDVLAKKATGKKPHIANMINDVINHMKSPDPPAPTEVTETKENPSSKVTPDVTEGKDEEESKDEIKKETDRQFKRPFHRNKKDRQEEEETASDAKKDISTETQKRHPVAIIRLSKTNDKSGTDLISNISSYIHLHLSPLSSDNNNISSKITTTTNTISTNGVDAKTETAAALVLTTDQDKSAYDEKDPQSVLTQIPAKRPRRCFIPLIHIFSGRCRRLARERPLFDLKALTDAIMQ